MNTVYVVEQGSLLEGQESGGISIALVAKHKWKDQLIDKILIRAFDFNDRSVKLAAAPSPSSTFLPLPRFVSFSRSPPLPVFLSRSIIWNTGEKTGPEFWCNSSFVFLFFLTSLKSQMH